MSAGENRRMFDRIARRYDLLNRLLSLGMDRYWRRTAVRALAPQNGERFLDVGCGTGDVAIEIVRQAPRASVVGIDPARAMLEIAEARIREASLSDRVAFRPVDVKAADSPDASFDGVACAFCIRNIPDRPAALERMRKLLRPGGRAVILELTRPSIKLVRLAHRLYNRWIVPLAGRFLSPRAEAYRYLVESIECFPDPQAILDAMSDAGFENVSLRGLTAGVVTIFTGNAP